MRGRIELADRCIPVIFSSVGATDKDTRASDAWTTMDETSKIFCRQTILSNNQFGRRAKCLNREFSEE